MINFYYFNLKVEDWDHKQLVGQDNQENIFQILNQISIICVDDLAVASQFVQIITIGK